MKTNASRQPKLSAVIRGGVALCVFVWVTGTALCYAERLCNCTGHSQSNHDHEAVAGHEHGDSHDAEHHRAGAGVHEHAAQSDHGPKSKKCNDENRCCSTIQAFVVTPTPIIIAKPVTAPVLMFSLLCAAREHALTAPTKSLRQPKPRDWVFTPEVCLGPALHSLAPPSSA